MIKFSAGLAIIIFTFILGIYFYAQQNNMFETKSAGLEEALNKRKEGKDLQQRMRAIRARSMVAGDDQKFTVERLLDIGAPGMEWRFVGQPRQYGSNKALYRHTFRISGPATYTDSQEVLRKLVILPGFVPYRYCYACALVPKGTPPDQRNVQIEGYLYVYDPNTFY